MHQKQFLDKIIKKYGDKFTFIHLPTIFKITTIIQCRCNHCNKIYYVHANNMLRKNAKICNCEENYNRFIKKAKEKHGNKYNYNKVIPCSNYGKHGKLQIFCNTCKKYFWQSAANHLAGSGCIICNQNFVSNTVEFIKKAITLHGNKFDYSEVNYINARTKVKIKCNSCKQIFQQTPNTHLNSQHCPYCFGTYHPTEEEVYLKLENKYPNKYEYLGIENYKNKYSKIKIRCKQCNTIFTTSIMQHFAHRNCMGCKQSKGEKQVEDYLKVHKINYIYQKTFSDCKNKRVLPFDFYLPDYNACIEFQGKQHYIENCYFKHGNLEYRQHNDEIKRKYCQEKGILLIEIKYTDDDINKKLSEVLNGK